jgi:hypothetical protein
VEPRGAAQYYVPLFGWALYFAAALTEGTRRLVRHLPENVARWRAPVLMTAAVLVPYPYYKALGHDNVTSVTVDGVMLRSLVTQTLGLHPILPGGARLLLLHQTPDPAWDVYLRALRLRYRDPDIVVHREPRIKPERYDVVLDYRGGQLVDADRPADPRVNPIVVEICHSDFSPATAQKPVQRGERVIVKAAGLGGSEPEVADGETFPADPLAGTVYRIGAIVNGARAQTFDTFGWPRTVNEYRVDVRVPKSVKPGAATLQFWVRGVVSPAFEFQVR